MDRNLIRWLHLSDFHIGKDGYEQTKIFKNILQHIADETKEKKLDFIFITGDIADKSVEKEYYDFIENFLEEIPNKTSIKIYIVPGNHDIDRTIVERVGRASSDSKFFRADTDGLTERKKYEITAFEQFGSFMQLASISENNWLNTEDGVFVDTVELDGIKVGIVGTNTAWLSRDDKDKGQLSFGVDLVKKGLEKIKEYDIRIVLGHHPIDWFLPSKLDTVKNIFKDYGVIYLHGHLHATKTTIGQYANSNFLNIQAGASFQASENKSKDIKNGLLWGEINLTNNIIAIQPRYWDYTQQRWEFNNDYLETDARRNGNENWWEYQLPTKKGEKRTNTQTTKSKDIVPNEWKIVDSNFFIESNKIALTDDNYIKYFDGAIPKWHSDFLKSIPERNIVQQICDEFKSSFEDSKSLFYFLGGAGGEGKTTASRQIVFQLYETSQWVIFWQNNKNIIFPEDYEFFTDKKYLLAFEDINKKTVKNIQNLLQKYSNISILISARTSDWIHSDGSKIPWSEYIEFKENNLKGLEEEEATKIVEFWAKYRQKGLKELYGQDNKTIVTKLLEASKSKGNDTFFGAILEVRMGNQLLDDHIEPILKRLNSIEIEKSNLTLLHAFVPIVLMHSEGLEFFSESVLAKYIFNDSTKSIKSKIITPLGKEAAAVTAGNFLFTRHKKIADETRKILKKEDYSIDSNEIFLELIKSAVDIWLAGEYMPKEEIKLWRFKFSKHFINTNKKLAIDIAKILLEREGKVQNLTHLSSLYREISELELARELFLDFDISTEKDSDTKRGFIYDWGVIEGLSGNHGLNAWLAATSISDWNYQVAPNNERYLKSLTGLSQAFEKLSKEYSNSVFTEASEASAILALKIDPKDKSPQLIKYKDSKITIDEALMILIKSVLNSWDCFDKNESLQSKIPSQSEMSFNSLKKINGV